MILIVVAVIAGLVYFMSQDDEPTAASPPEPVPENGEEECPNKCPPHAWVEVGSKTPEETKRDLQKQIDAEKNSPSNAEQVRGHQFEMDALTLNEKKYPVEKTSVVYRCSKCGQEQEVDIVFKDGRIGESKSRNAKQIDKKLGDQSRRLSDIQRQLNEQSKRSAAPLAKLDKRLDDVDKAGRIFERRGFDVEKLLTGS